MTQIFLFPADLSLYQCMEEMQRRLSLNEAMFYWLQILDAVDYLHNLPVPVIHKDIKGKEKWFDVESHVHSA